MTLHPIFMQVILRMPSFLTIFETIILPHVKRALIKANIDSCIMHMYIALFEIMTRYCPLWYHDYRYCPLWYHGHAYRSECCWYVYWRAWYVFTLAIGCSCFCRSFVCFSIVFCVWLQLHLNFFCKALNGEKITILFPLF